MVCSIKHFFDTKTYTLTYVVYDEESKDAVVIDSVLDFDLSSGNYSTTSADQLLRFINENDLTIHYVLETHAHADHLSASEFLMDHFPSAKLGISTHITQVQKTFKDILGLVSLSTNGSQFTVLFNDDELVSAGTLSFKVLSTPGHTPACASFLFSDEEKSFVFTGDALFMPDYGTGRCDFPGGSAEDLYVSISNVLYELGDDTIVFVGHDYLPGGRELAFQTTIGESKQKNIRLSDGISEEEFIQFRRERDAKLNTPKLLYPSIQVNIDGGKLPKAESNGTSYIKIPLTKS